MRAGQAWPCLQKTTCVKKALRQMFMYFKSTHIYIYIYIYGTLKIHICIASRNIRLSTFSSLKETRRIKHELLHPRFYA